MPDQPARRSSRSDQDQPCPCPQPRGMSQDPRRDGERPDGSAASTISLASSQQQEERYPEHCMSRRRCWKTHMGSHRQCCARPQPQSTQGQFVAPLSQASWQPEDLWGKPFVQSLLIPSDAARSKAVWQCVASHGCHEASGRKPWTPQVSHHQTEGEDNASQPQASSPVQDIASEKRHRRQSSHNNRCPSCDPVRWQ